MDEDSVENVNLEGQIMTGFVSKFAQTTNEAEYCDILDTVTQVLFTMGFFVRDEIRDDMLEMAITKGEEFISDDETIVAFVCFFRANPWWRMQCAPRFLRCRCLGRLIDFFTQCLHSRAKSADVLKQIHHQLVEFCEPYYRSSLLDNPAYVASLLEVASQEATRSWGIKLFTSVLDSKFCFFSTALPALNSTNLRPFKFMLLDSEISAQNRSRVAEIVRVVIKANHSLASFFQEDKKSGANQNCNQGDPTRRRQRQE